MPDTKAFSRSLNRFLERYEKSHEVNIRVKPDPKEGQWDKAIKDKAKKSKVKVPVEADVDDEKAKKDVESAFRNLHTGQNVAIRVPAGIDEDVLVADVQAGMKQAQDDLDRHKEKLALTLGVSTEEAEKHIKSMRQRISTDDVEMTVDLDLESQRKMRELENKKFEAQMKVELERQAQVEAQLRALARRRWADIHVRVTKSSLDTARRALEALSGFNIVRSSIDSMRSFLETIDRKALRFASLATKVGTLMSGVLTMMAGIVTIGGDILSIGGFISTLPAAAASIGAFAAAGVAAFKNFGTAVQGSEDALRALPDNAKSAARSLRGVWTSIRIPTQQAFWSQMNGVFEQLVKNTIPAIREGMTGVGEEMGGLARNFMSGFSSDSAVSSIKTMFDQLKIGIGEMADEGSAFSDAIVRIGEVGAEHLPDMGRYLGEIARQFSSWVARSDELGKFDQWIENAKTNARNLWDSLVSIKRIFSGLGDAARNGGMNYGLKGAKTTLERIERTVNGPVFQDGMRQIFQGAKEGMEILTGGITTLGRALGHNAPVIRQILKDTGSVLNSLLTGVAGGINTSGFQKGITGFFDGLASGASKFSEYLPGIMEGFGSLGGVLGHMIDEFAPVLGRFFEDIATTLSKAAPTMKEFSTSLARLVDNGLGMAGTAFLGMVTALSTLLDLFNSMPQGIQNLLFWLAVLRKFKISGRNNIFGGRLTQPLRQELRNAPRWIQGSTRQIGRAWDGLNQRLAAPIAAPGVGQLRQQTTGLGSRLGGIFRNAAGAIKSSIAAATTATKTGLGRFARAADSATRQAGRKLSGLGSRLTSWTRNVTGDVRRSLGDQRALRRFTRQYATRLNDAVGKIPGQIRPIGIDPNNMMRFTSFRGIASHAMPGISDAARRMVSGFRTAFSSGMRNVMNDPRIIQARGLARNLSSWARGMRTKLSAQGRLIAQDLTRPIRAAMNSPIGQRASGIARTAATTARQYGRVFSSTIATSVNAKGALSSLAAFRRMFATEGTMAGRAYAQGLSTSMSTMTLPLHPAQMQGQRIGARLMQGMRSAVGKAATGLWSFIGGGWGLAFIAGLAIWSDIQQKNAEIEESVRKIEQAWKDVGKAAFDAGEDAFGSEARNGAKKFYEEQIKGLKLDSPGGLGDLGGGLARAVSQMFNGSAPGGVGQTKTMEKFLSKYGFNEKDILDYLTVQSEPALDFYLKSLQTQLEQDAGESWSWASMLPGGDERAAKGAAAAQIEQIRQYRKGVEEELRKNWYVDPVAGIKNVGSRLKEVWGQVTLENIDGIRSTADGARQGLSKVTQYATLFATEMGGSSDAVKQNTGIIEDALRDTGKAGVDFGKFWKDPIGALKDFNNQEVPDEMDRIREAVIRLQRAGVPTANISRGLEAVGIDVEEFERTLYGNAIQENLSGPLTIAGEAAYKVSQNSDGFKEVARAVGNAAEIDPSRLERVFAMGGYDPKQVGANMAAMGYGIDEIQAALKTFDANNAQEVAGGVDAARAALERFQTSGVLNPGKAEDFANAIAAIRDSAEDAATKADLLWEALDRLNGGTSKKFDLQSEYGQAIDEFRKLLNPEGEDAKSPFANLKFNDDGSLSALSEGSRKFGASLKELSQKRLRVFNQTFQDVLKTTGKYKPALKAAQDAVGDFDTKLDKSFQGAIDQGFLTREQLQGIRDDMHALPKTQKYQVLTQVKGDAIGELAQIALDVEALDGKQHTVQIKTLSDKAQVALEQMGVKVTKLTDGGPYQLTFGANAAEAEKKADEVVKNYQNRTPKMKLDAEKRLALLRLQETKKIINDTLAFMGIDADPKKAKEKVAGTKGFVERTIAMFTVDADTAPVKPKVHEEASWVKTVKSMFMVGADTSDAQMDAQGAKTIIEAIRPIMDVTAQITDVWGDLGVLPVTAQVTGVRGLNIPDYVANGAIYNGRGVKKYASGGIENHVAQIQKATSSYPVRIWAEPETGGEAYIPLAMSKRVRSEAILGKVATHFGKKVVDSTRNVERYDNGGIDLDLAPGRQQVFYTTVNYPVEEKTSTVVTRLGQRMAQIGE